MRSKDPFQIPKAGLEVAPLAGLASINVNGSVGPVSGTEFVGESTLGGVLIYAIYQALLTALRTEAMRQRGALLCVLVASELAEEGLVAPQRGHPQIVEERAV